VFRLVIEGLSVAEIAVELGITPRNVREQRRRPRDAVTTVLEDEGIV